jgi:crotonobetainyl-CoA:carnitine CoA-transferase CaiB-like acyl-CoA transferase
VLLPSELASHPLHVARQVFFQTTPSAEAPPESALPQVRTPLTPRGAVAAAPPTQGQHSVQILRESGFSDAEIAELQQAGVTR